MNEEKGVGDGAFYSVCEEQNEQEGGRVKWEEKKTRAGAFQYFGGGGGGRGTRVGVYTLNGWDPSFFNTTQQTRFITELRVYLALLERN